jgi:hypothetical protein
MPSNNIASECESISVGIVRRRDVLLGGGAALLLSGCSGAKNSSASKAEAATAEDAKPWVGSPQPVKISQFYKPEHGVNLQPAIQNAVDHAAKHKLPLVVNDFGPITSELWCPPRRTIFSLSSRHSYDATDGFPLVIRRPVHIDFKGATFNLKGPGGGPREQSVGGDYPLPYYGGWVRVVGSPDFNLVTIENVVVDGHFQGSRITANDSNLTDKGFWLHGRDVKEVRLRNVELRNFGGEIYYVAGWGPELQYLENCHFHGSSQCCFNPGAGGGGKLIAINLQCGRCYQTAESTGAGGHRYIGGRFYDAGGGGANFIGGPAPGLVSGYPLMFAYWDGEGERPWVQFEDTQFERCGYLNIGAWMRGRIQAIDTRVAPRWRVGHLRDIDLQVDSWCDTLDGMDALILDGPPDLTTRFEAMPYEYYYEKPSDLRFRINCRRTERAIAENRRHRAALSTYGRLIDPQTTFVEVTGEAAKLTHLMLPAVPGFAWPQIVSSGFVATG